MTQRGFKVHHHTLLPMLDWQPWTETSFGSSQFWPQRGCPSVGKSKVPQPGVDLVNMAALPHPKASTIGTSALKRVLLSAAVRVWNS